MMHEFNEMKKVKEEFMALQAALASGEVKVANDSVVYVPPIQDDGEKLGACK
jgi:hypothetical protein